MPTITRTVAASADDADISNIAYADTTTAMQTGGVSTAPLANYGQGWRFLNIPLDASHTIVSARLLLMKNTGQWLTVALRIAAIAEDNTAVFSSGSPPGARPITSNIAIESPNTNHLDGTVYAYPPSGAEQIVLGAAIQEVIDRVGWVSGNALAIVCNSDQDAGASESFSREDTHTYDSAVADSEPQLEITYTDPVNDALVLIRQA